MITVATRWVSAAVGVAAGTGMLIEAVLGTCFVLSANTLLCPIVNAINRQPLDVEPAVQTAPVRPWDVAPTSIQLALARGHRWLAMLESGEAKSLKEIATREGIDNSYVSRMVNLTTLAPDIVAAILDDALPNHITLFDLAVDPPALWDEQGERVGL